MTIVMMMIKHLYEDYDNHYNDIAMMIDDDYDDDHDLQ